MSNFGPRIIGDAAFQQQQAKAKGGSHFGPRVKDGVAPASAPPETPATAAAPTPATGLSIEQFKAILAENPSFLDALYTQELERPGGPRAECLTVARDVSVAGGHADITTEIDEVLADLAGDSGASAALKQAVERILALDKLALLHEEAIKLGLDPKPFTSKKAAREAIIAKLAQNAGA